MIPSDPPRSEDPIRVLHVDDELHQLEFAKTFIEFSDRTIHMESVTTPKEALDRLRDENFDCIVSDYQMSGMDGIELAGKIRETSDVPIIIYTGRGSEEVAEAAFTVGVNDYLRKETNPSHYQVLARRIRAAAEKHRAENALKESEGKYRSLVQNSRDGILVFTGSELVYANQKAAALHGCNTVEELMKVGPSSLLHPEDREWIEERSLARQRGEDVPPISEFRLVLPGGAVRMVQSSSSVIEYSGKTSTLAFLRDITERKRTEEELRGSEDRLRGFMDSATEAFRIFDSELNFLDVNDAALVHLGLKKDEVIGRNLKDVNPYVEESGRYDQYLEVIRTGEPRFISEAPSGPQTGDKSLSISAFKVQEGLGLISIDITERKLLMEEMRKAEERLELIFEYAPDAIYLNDMKGTFIDGNRAAEKLTGYTKEELVGKSFLKLNLLSRRQIPKAAKLLAQNLMGQQTGPDDFTITRKNGERVSVEISTYPVKLRDGRVVMGIARDITERKQAEEELRESEDRLRGFMDSATDGFMLLDSELNFVEINNASVKMGGLSRDEFIGNNILEIAPYLKETGRIDEYRRVIESGEPFFNEDYIVHPKFGGRHVSLAAFKVGKGLGIITTDITDRKLMAERLQESESMYRELTERSMDVIYKADLEGRLTYVSPSVEDVFGYSQEELTGESFFKLLPEDELPKISAAIKDAVGGEYIQMFQTEVLRKDGARLTVETNSAQILERGNLVGFQGVIRDITERKQAEEELQKSREQLRAITTNAGDAIIVMDHHGNITFWNPAAQSMFGYTSEEAEGVFLHNLIVPLKYHDSFTVGFEKFLKTGQGPAIGNTLELYGKKKDETEFPVELSLSSMRTEDGWHTIGIIRDISVRKRMGDELRERNWALGERMKELNCLYRINELVEQPGISLESIFQGVVNLIPPAWQHPEVTCARVAVGDSVFETENFRETKWRQSSNIVVHGEREGALDVFYLEERPVFDEGPFLKEERNLIEGITEGLGRTIESMRLEEENLLHLGRLDVLHDHVAEMASAITLDEVIEKTFEAIGKTLEHNIGSFHIVEKEMVKPISTLDFRLSGLIPISIEGPGIVARTVRYGASQLVPDTRSDPDFITGPEARGIELLSELAVPVIIDGRVEAVINIESVELGAFDSNDQRLVEILADHVASAINRIRRMEELEHAIEDRELAERELLEYTETLNVAVVEKTREVLDLERLSAAGKVAAMVGHDLRGPLQTIKNSLYLMERNPEAGAELRKAMDEAVNYAASMLEELRLKVGDSPLQLQEVNLGALIRKAVDEASIPDSVETEMHVAEGLDSASMDPLKIRRVLDNLVRNAVEAMPDGGSLEVSAVCDGDVVFISVRDTGTGIPEDLMPDLFKAFVTTKPQGMGLGLAYCKRAVEAHGGTIVAQSKAGEGTTIIVEIPTETS